MVTITQHSVDLPPVLTSANDKKSGASDLDVLDIPGVVEVSCVIWIFF